MATSSGHHALVIGASGLVGWSVVNQLLQPYPAPSPFDKVTALVNRPLNFEDSLWPSNKSNIPGLALASGVDLMCKDDEFVNLLKEKVHDVASISHVFYFGMSTTAVQ
jgi:nucleoside-diphosphate-sugar epimerase